LGQNQSFKRHLKWNYINLSFILFNQLFFSLFNLTLCHHILFIYNRKKN